MQFTSRQLANVIVAAPTGRIDQTGAPTLEQALAPLLAQSATDKGPIVIDFTGVEYISSVGLRVLMIASKQMRTSGARIVLAAPQPVVAEILKISRFDRVLEIAPTVRRALEWLSGPALHAYDAAPGKAGA